MIIPGKQFKFKMDILGVNNTLLSWNHTELQIIHETATDVKLWKQKYSLLHALVRHLSSYAKWNEYCIPTGLGSRVMLSAHCMLT